MFGSIGPAELVLIFVIALLVFGPKKLPEIGRSVGKALREFKKTSEEIKGRIEEEIEASEIKDIRKDLQTGVDNLKSSVKTITDDITKEPETVKAPETAKEPEPAPAVDAAKATSVAEDMEHHEHGEGPKVS
jgi:sec-independent protein translocase protein TatA